MKTRFIALMLALLLCLGFAACGDEDVPPLPPVEIDTENENAVKADTLRVVTDLDWKYKAAYGVSGATQAKQTFEQMIKYFE